MEKMKGRGQLIQVHMEIDIFNGDDGNADIRYRTWSVLVCVLFYSE